MRVNGFLSHVSGITKVRLYDEYAVYVNDMSVNEYFNEYYDASFVDYEANSISVQDGILCVAIDKANKSQLADTISEIKEQLESLQESLTSFEEEHL